jgi:hypothetical protein
MTCLVGMMLEPQDNRDVGMLLRSHLFPRLVSDPQLLACGPVTVFSDRLRQEHGIVCTSTEGVDVGNEARSLLITT